MTSITLTKNEKNEIVGLECLGHTGSNEFGQDIVCAAISSITQTACLGLLMVAGLNINLKRDEKKGFLSFKLPSNVSEIQMHDAQIILATMKLGLDDLYSVYSDFIEILENN